MNSCNFFISLICLSQNTIPEVLKKYNKNDVPYISVEELKVTKNILLLDTREPYEYKVSHLDNAVCVGHTKFDSKAFLAQYPNKEAKIVVYCSIGVRSEQIGEKLIKLGYKNVQNLYGGIFEWKNKNNAVVDENSKETDKVHAYSKEWGIYLTNGIKIYKK
ncbi:MAG: rhodanese-like domain-containing protein [Flavobacterium sp.]|nr:rhodanese-like domain-containing protein [Flavobacterium sp.]